MDSMISTRFSGCPGSCLHETENEIFSIMVREGTNHGNQFVKIGQPQRNSREPLSLH